MASNTFCSNQHVLFITFADRLHGWVARVLLHFPDRCHMLDLLLDLLIDKKAVKGWVGEKLAAANFWLHLDEKVYRRLHDVIIPTSNGTTQIDHVILSVFGIFVVETKNFRGWIFGDPKESQWCQSLPGGKKRRFQSPLHQNYRHIQCLGEFLKLDPKVFQSVVFFIGECELKHRCRRT